MKGSAVERRHLRRPGEAHPRCALAALALAGCSTRQIVSGERCAVYALAIQLASLSEVIEKHPDDPQAYNMRGSVLAEAGNAEAGARRFQQGDQPRCQLRAGLRQSRRCSTARAASWNWRWPTTTRRWHRRLLRARLSRARHRLSPARQQHAGARRLQQGDRAAAGQRAGLLQSRPALSGPASAPVRRRRFHHGHRACDAEGRAVRGARARAIWRSATPRPRRPISTRRCRCIRRTCRPGPAAGSPTSASAKGKAAGSYAKALNINEKYEPAAAGFARVGGKVGQTYQTF